MSVTEESKYLAIEGSASTAEEAIRLCGDELVRQGCVGDTFAQSCIDREVNYPTGICSEVPVALPHCASEDIQQNSVCYLRLTEPVKFYRMDDPDDFVMTRHVFNLAISRGDHLQFLSKIIGILQEPQVLTDMETMDIAEIGAFLRNLVENE